MTGTYAASSFLSTAIAKTFGSALNGTCKENPELVEEPFPLEVTIAALSASGGEAMARNFFEPLGYAVDLEGQLLDEQFPDWGKARILSSNCGTFCPSARCSATSMY